MCSFNEAIKYRRRNLEAFSETNSGQPCSNLLSSRASEWHVISDEVERFHLLKLSLIANKNDWNLGLLDNGCDSSHTSTVTGRHAIDLIHNEDELFLFIIHLFDGLL